MINEIQTWAMGIWYAHTPMVATLAYGVPAINNAIDFTLRTVKEYRKDLVSRATAREQRERWDAASNEQRDRSDMHYPSSYDPTLTVGHLVGRFLGIVLPLVNVIVMIANLDRVFEFLWRVFDWLGKVLDIPLVPKR